MILKSHEAARALARFDPELRLYIFGGPDETGSQALRDTVVATMSGEPERIDLSPSRIKEDPAIIADEAASISLFGGMRWVSVTINSGSGDEVLVAAENLLNASAAGNPVIITVSGLTAKSRLTKLAENDARAVAIISYTPEVRDVGQIVAALAAPLGLEISHDVAGAIAQATGRDRGLIAREIEKLALYCDASPDSKTRATLSDWQAIGAGLDGDDLGPLINATFGGQVANLPNCLAELDRGGALDIRLVRSLSARAHLLARLRVDVEGGASPGQVMAAQGRAVFWKEKEAVQQQLSRWDAARLARIILKLHALESNLKAPDNPGALLVRQTIMEIALAGVIRN